MGQYLRNDNDNDLASDVERRSYTQPPDAEVNFDRDVDIEAGRETPEPPSLSQRFDRLERHHRYLWLVLVATFLLAAYVTLLQFGPRPVTVEKTLTESDAIKLVDNAGTTRLYLRMYSQEPVLQLMDSRGNPRLSLGMRFDDTPFIDLSDQSGRTRATFQMSEDDEPVFRLYDEKGQPSFAIN